jgi:hypothetical protein
VDYGAAERGEVRDVSRLPIAEDFEALAAATVHERGPVPIKASKGRTRPIFVERDGAVVGVTTPGKVLEAVALAIEVEISTQGETRPTMILCLDCRCPVPVAKTAPKIPVRCKKHAADEWQRRYREANGDKVRANSRKAQRKFYEKKKAATS